MLRLSAVILVALGSTSAFAQPYAFVTNSPQSAVSVVDLGTNLYVTSVSGFSQDVRGIAATRDGTRVYVADYGASSVVGIDTITFQRVSSVTLPTKPNSVAAIPDGTRLYVAAEGNRIYVVDPFAQTIVQTIQTSGVFEHIILNKAGTRAYASSQSGVVVIDTSNNSVLPPSPISTQATPQYMALSANESILYVATSAGLAQINTANNTFIRRDIQGSNFRNVLTRPGTGDPVYVTSESAGTVSLWNANNTQGPVANAGTPVRGIAALTSNAAYLTAPTTNKVLRLNLTNNTVDATIDLAIAGTGTPAQIAIPPVRQLAGCVPDILFPTSAAPAQGTEGAIFYELNLACGAPSVTTNVPWITPGQPSTVGNQSFLPYTVTANTSTAARTGAIFVNGRRFLITQAGTTCTYSITPGSKQAPNRLDSAVIFVGAPAGCEWSATTDAPWITLSDTSTRNGSGYFIFTIQPNATANRRMGTVFIAGQPFTVTQAAAGASYECQGFNLSFDSIRSEGLTEGLEDLRITCSGPLPPGGATGDILVTLTSMITSKLTGPAADDLDVWLILNNATNPVPGTTAFRGKLAGPTSVRFQNVPLTNVVNGTATFNIVNLRVNASSQPPPEAGGFLVAGTVQIKSATFIPFSGDFLALGIASRGMITSAGESGTLAGGEQMLPITFTEEHLASFRPKNKPPNPVIPARYEAESLFMHANLGAAAGAADTGTRLRLRIPVAAGVRVWAPVNLLGAGSACLVSADANGLGGSCIAGSPLFGGTYQELTQVSGFATGVWEVTAADPFVRESRTASLVFQGGDLTAITRGLISSFAPTSTTGVPNATQPVPRFLDPLATPRIVNLRIVSTVRLVGTSSNSKTVVRSVVGSNFRFSYQVVNDSTETATNVVVRGNLPPGFNYSSCSRSDGGPCAVSGTDIRAEVPELAGGADVTVNVQATQTAAIAGGTILENSVSASSDQIDADIQSNQASTAFLVDTCPVTLNPAANSVPGSGGQFTFTFGSCVYWATYADVPWITITSPRSGTGAGSVSYTVAPNPTTSPRTGSIIAAGQNHTVTQAAAPACTFTLAANSDTFDPVGAKRTVQLTASGANCSWTASSPASWVQVFPLSGTTSTAVEYNVFPNFGTPTRSATLTIAGRPFTVTQTGSSFTNDQRFVQLAYFFFLGRLPSPTELALQVAALQTGTSRAQIILNFFNAEEFNQGGRFVAGLYVGLLDRDAEYGGWLFQRDALAKGIVGQTSQVANFLDSAEYKLKFGTVSAPQFVTLLYRHVLLREPGANEVAFHVATSLTPDSTNARVELARRFLNTAEFRQGTGTRLTSFLLFATLLQRDGSAQERAFWSGQIQAGVPLINIFAAIIGTPEFAALLN